MEQMQKQAEDVGARVINELAVEVDLSRARQGVSSGGDSGRNGLHGGARSGEIPGRNRSVCAAAQYRRLSRSLVTSHELPAGSLLPLLLQRYTTFWAQTELM
jgi:hypothetical protein